MNVLFLLWSKSMHGFIKTKETSVKMIFKKYQKPTIEIAKKSKETSV